MHRDGCPQRNNPYAHCQCAVLDQVEHTYQLQRFNENMGELVRLRAELDEANRELARYHEDADLLARYGEHYCPPTAEERREELEQMEQLKRDLVASEQARLAAVEALDSALGTYEAIAEAIAIIEQAIAAQPKITTPENLPRAGQEP